MSLRSLYSEVAQGAYEAVRDAVEFHAQWIAITEDVPIDEARRIAWAEAEATCIATLAGGLDAQS